MREPTLLEKLIENLAGNIPKWSLAYMPKEHAYQQLKAMLGRDLGPEAEAWRQWVAHPTATEHFELSALHEHAVEDDIPPPEESRSDNGE